MYSLIWKELLLILYPEQNKNKSCVVDEHRAQTIGRRERNSSGARMLAAAQVFIITQ